MTILLFKNNAASTLASPITDSAVTLTVVAGEGADFPSPAAGQYFIATLVDAATGTISEIIWVTSRTGDVLTIQRGQEGTAPLAWNAGDAVKMLPTAGTMQALMQVQQSQAGAPNYALDTGTVNSYAATLNPVVSTRIPGLVVRILAATANTGPSTLNLGAGSGAIINPDGTPLGTGAIVAGGIFEVFDDGTNYQLISANNQAASSAGADTTGDFKWRPTSETITGYVVANATTIGNASSNATQLANVSASALFAWHWNNFSNTQCPVFTSAGAPTTRGVSAAADFAANKAIQVYDKRGKGCIGVDTMGGGATTRLTGVPVTSGNATTPGSVLGENLHSLTSGENGAHTHGITDPGHTHSYVINPIGNYGGINTQNVYAGPPSGTPTGSSVTGISVNSAGSGTGHNTVELSDTGYWYIKL